ncbi:B12-binding domain-containing radical SAM protein [Paenibacillus sp. 1001270B_150601_E10]|uniref:B12-binding domain-containing radical SAM protein n=1 Tax=Paenibacillus sp. 1001270B_150601_E10 TaxID=2787079 RepID=UPI00189FA572|nr:radical SAM protein [Paenibacillus sp. 1001270B_150601_E10]
MGEKTVVLVSTGLLKAKKENNPFNRMNRYLNYGLLGLATVLKNRGYTVKMFQGEYRKPHELIKIIKDSDIDLNQLKYPILLSIPSYYSLPWAKEFCGLVKNEYELKIVGGGRWVIGDSDEWIKSKIPEVDLWITGLGDEVIEQALYPGKWKSIEVMVDKVECFYELDYTLLYDFKEYQPSIEVSRGCGRGCSFCMEKNVPITQLKEPTKLISEIKRAIDMYQCDDINFYFEASLFLPGLSWARKFKELYIKENLAIKWRCESRVDALTPEIIHELAQAGLKVVDLGLESASIRQLKAMNKTKKPESYLEKAQLLIKACHKEGINVKVNVLLYAGENLETIAETKKWLLSNKEFIKGVSVNPVVVYGPYCNYDYFNSLGATVIDTSDALGYSYMHLSDEIDYEQSLQLGNDLSRSVMSEDDYFTLKKFSYFPRSYQYEDFIRDIKEANEESLPFVTVKEANQG